MATPTPRDDGPRKPPADDGLVAATVTLRLVENRSRLGAADSKDKDKDGDEKTAGRDAETVAPLGPLPSLLDGHAQRVGDSAADALAREVGYNAYEYLEECFYTEVSVLDRDKFDAVPETVKADFRVLGHLGKGCFSDVIEVACVGGPLLDGTPGAAATSGRSPRMRGRRFSLSHSINVGSLSRPTPARERPVYAMKCLRPSIRSAADQFSIGAEDLVHETALLANLDHPHIIRLHGRAKGHLTNAFVLNDGYFIILDKLTATLHDRIAGWRELPGAERTPTHGQLAAARDIADAVSYLHARRIVFRDLKPANVGFDARGALKLFDFGFAVGLPAPCTEDAAPEEPGPLLDRCGTPRYMAPEVGLSRGYGTAVDAYSFGIVLWEICALQKPFHGITSAEVFERAVFRGGARPPLPKEGWPRGATELMEGCWAEAPGVRPSMREVKARMAALASAGGREKAPLKVPRMSSFRRRSDEFFS